ncbi:MAG: hypothetical protein ACI32H_05050 [Bacilli bacterium]
MKKKLFIITLLIGSILPIIVKANNDIGITDVYDYEIVIDKDIEVTCINPNTYKIRKIILKKGDIKKIYGEGDCVDYYNHKIDYSGLCFKDKEYVCQYGLYDEDFENFHIKDLEYDVNKNENDITYFNNFDGFLFNYYDDYIGLNSGPSYYYKVIKKINTSEKIKVLGKIKGYDWYYIETQNVKGWITDDDLMIKQNKEYVSYQTQDVYKDQRHKIKIGELKVNSIVKNPYKDGYRDNYYINYDGMQGYIKDGLYERKSGTTTIKYDGILYEEADVNSKQLIDKRIKKGQKINYDSFDKILYYTENCEGIKEVNENEECEYEYVWYNTTIDSKTGWLLVSNYLDKYIKDNTEEIIDEGDDENEINNISKEEIKIENVSFKTNQIKADEKLYIDFKIDNNSLYEVDKVLFGFKNNKDQNRLLYLNDIESSPYLNIEHSLFEDGEFELYFIRLELNDEDNTRLVYYTNEIKNNSDYSLKVINDIKDDEKESETKDEEKDQAIKEIHKINNKHLLIGIISAISITITSIILIILINKRRKENKN